MPWSYLLFVIPVLVGLAVGLLLGGRIRGVADAELHATWVLWGAALVQIAGHTAGVPTLPLVFTLVLCWLAANLHGRQIAVRLALSGILVGLAANGLAIALNGRMPYSPDAAAMAGIAPGTSSARNAPETSGTWLPWLGDVLPITPLSAVISVGDIAIALGIAALIPALMTAGPRVTETRRGGDPHERNP